MSRRTNNTNYNNRRRAFLRDFAKTNSWDMCMVCRTLDNITTTPGGAKDVVCSRCLTMVDFTHVIPCVVDRKTGKRRVRGLGLSVRQNLFPALFKNPTRFIQQRYVYMNRVTVRAMRKLIREAM